MFLGSYCMAFDTVELIGRNLLADVGMDQCLRQEIDEHDIQLEYGICWAVLNMTGWWFGTFFIFHDKKRRILPID